MMMWLLGAPEALAVVRQVRLVRLVRLVRQVRTAQQGLLV
jgi:hypothetical protein